MLYGICSAGFQPARGRRYHNYVQLFTERSTSGSEVVFVAIRLYRLLYRIKSLLTPARPACQSPARWCKLDKVVTGRASLVISLARWFDSWESAEDPCEDGPPRVDWVRCLPFVVLHLMCFSVIWVGWSWVAVAVALALYVIRMFTITGFYHRYFSHRAFKTSRWCQFVFAALGTSAGQRGPLWWAALHRYHHQHSDQRGDIHSPNQHGFLWSHMGWFTAKSNFATNLKAVPDLAKFPELCLLDRFDVVMPILLVTFLYMLGVTLAAFAPGLGTNGLQMLVWGFFISTVLLYHATYTINSLAHLLGKKRYHTKDESRNSFILALITLGEGWHNNHHHYPTSIQQGFYWWEIDITYYLLVLLSWTGLIWDLKPVPERIRNAERIDASAPDATAPDATAPDAAAPDAAAPDATAPV